jgi:hypothetical protein
MNRTPATDLEHLIAQLEADSSLLEPDQLRKRLEVLDALDALLGDAGSTAVQGESALHRRAQAIRTRLEAVNSELYRSIRLETESGAPPAALLRWLQNSASPRATENPTPGLGYDYQDELVSGVLQLREPGIADVAPAPEMVFYQPTPVRHILRLIAVSALSAADVLVDLGSGLGHVPMLASILTGARSIGIEVEPAYVACARECALSLGLSRVTFVRQDARTADLSAGTIFHLYTPFTGTILTHVLERLRSEGSGRPIKISTLGPCTPVVAAQLWLQADAPPNPDQISLFHSRN